MVIINKIYTRTGDRGETQLVGGQRIPKDAIRVECYGDIDELNSVLGWARSVSMESLKDYQKNMELVQQELFDIGAELATPSNTSAHSKGAICEENWKRLELWIDQAIQDLPELRSFVLPGGSPTNSALHIARAVCRRAERHAVHLSKQENVSTDLLIYLNRLSDYLFALARRSSCSEGLPETLWKPGKIR